MNIIKMTADEIRTIVTANKGQMATVVLTDGDTVKGTLISVNTSGVNVKDANGKTISRGLKRVHGVTIQESETIADEAAAIAIAELDIDPANGDDTGEGIEEVAPGVFRVEDDGTDDDVELDEDTEADMMADSQEAGEIDWTDENTDLEFADEAADALVSELDGCTTAELAETFGILAKELRVTLRALGMGVGKGHRYHLTADQITIVKGALAKDTAKA